MRYDGRAVVDGMTFDAQPGRVLALLGPNGAGKTTTVETCEGFRAPDSGEVRVLGLDPRRDRRALAPRVGVMLQSGGVYPGARPAEMLRLVAALHAHPLDPEMLLEVLALQDVARTPYRRLSGGQRQRLSLAMAVVGRPELVLLDEPTAGLDPQARLAAWEMVRALREDGVTVLLTTHAMDEAEELADEVVIIDQGQVVARGTPAELTSSGAEGSLRFTASPGLDLDDLSTGLPHGLRAEEVRPGSYLVSGGADADALAAVTTWCAARGVRIVEISLDRRTLEDVFLDLTGRDLRT
ncbi:MAG TPA: ABC transporter ATP-binding protein [Mycobacteriales bacterium]|nr:ABC transporter ATP-binding protein [Mycobacteriales bacterium]